VKISVICVADRAERLPLLVWSLIAQTHQDWTLLVLDQSTEYPGVFRYVTVPPAYKDRVRIDRVHMVGDWGQSAKEQAAHLVDGDAVMFPADDAYYVPTALETMAAELDAGADLALCGWLYRLMGYAPMPPCPAVGHVDVGGFMVRRSTFLKHGWPSKGQTGDGELVVGLAESGARVALSRGVAYVQN
jgi:hypothetical protein